MSRRKKNRGGKRKFLSWEERESEDSGADYASPEFLAADREESREEELERLNREEREELEHRREELEEDRKREEREYHKRARRIRWTWGVAVGSVLVLGYFLVDGLLR